MSVILTPELVREMLEKQNESLVEAITAVLQKLMTGAAPAAAPAPTASAKKPRKKKDADAASDSGEAAAAAAEPKEKRPPNAWIVFTQRVEKMIREKEGAEPASKMKTVVIKQFCSHLKDQKAYADWADEEILSALESWTPPAVSKQAAEGKSKRSGSISGSESDGESGGAAAASVPSAASTAPPAAPAKKAVVIKKKPTAAAPPVDLKFRSWSHEGTDYYKNGRGDVISAEMEWVGHWDGKTIDESAPEPEDLATAEFADEE